MKSRYADDMLSPESYKATAIPSSFNKYADYLMIVKGNEYVDAKRIWPTMWLYIACGIGFF